MDRNHENMQHSEKIVNQESSNIVTPGEDVVDLTWEECHLGPSNSAIPVFPNASYMVSTGENGSDDGDAVKIVDEKPNPNSSAPKLIIEAKQDSGEIILDFLKKDPSPYNGCYTNRCQILEENLGLCVVFNLGGQGSSNRRKNEERPAKVTQRPPRRPTALYCGICRESHVEIFKSGKSLMSSFCGHVFCNLCLDLCEESHQKCVTCGKKLTRNQYHILYQ